MEAMIALAYMAYPIELVSQFEYDNEWFPAKA